MGNTGRLLLALAGALGTAPLAAQSRGAIELGAFGRWTKFGESLGSDATNRLPAENGVGAGVRLGVFVVRNLAIEADASYTKVDAAGGGRVRHIPLHAGLTYNVPLGEHAAFLLGARYVRNMYGDAASFDDSGIGGVAGFRFGPVRVEATFDNTLTNNPAHGKYHNLGVNAGLSLLLGGCNNKADGVTIAPTSTTLERGDRASFTAIALRCGKPGEVVWTATGGEITPMGQYTAGPTPGTYKVTATEEDSELSASAVVVIKEPPPPPPPPPPPAPVVTLTRIDLKPDRVRLRMLESAAFSVTGFYSDGSNKPVPDCPLTATGNPTRTGNNFSWGRPGRFTVTANCGGQSDESLVLVPLTIVIYGTNFRFNSDKLTPVGLDSVRLAADSLKKYSELQVRLAGFADFRGTDAYNCSLSWRRLHTVHHALNRFGIPDERFTAIEGFGEAYPIPDDQVPQEWKDINVRTKDKGKWWDRRVDITSLEKDEGMVACADPTIARKKP